MLAFRFGYFMQHPPLRPAAFFLLSAVLVSFVAVFILFRRDVTAGRLWQRLASRPGLASRLTGATARVYGAFYVCRTRPALLAKTFLMSAANHLAVVYACYLLSRALSAGVSLLMCITLFPAIGAIGAIPVTPGGLGVREGVAVHLFGAMGVPHMKAFLLGFLPYLSMLLWSLFGGIVFLVHSIRPGHSLKDELHELQDPAEPQG